MIGLSDLVLWLVGSSTSMVPPPFISSSRCSITGHVILVGQLWQESAPLSAIEA